MIHLPDLDFSALLIAARQRAEKMVANGLYSRFGYSYDQRIEKAMLGCMGELAFESVLRQKGIAYQLDQTDFSTRNSDAFDFWVNGKCFDIKVAKKSTPNPPNGNWTYGYPHEQNPAKKDVVVVGWVDFQRFEVGFYGYISGKKISRFPVVTQNAFAGYAYQTPNHEFKWKELSANWEALWKWVAL